MNIIIYTGTLVSLAALDSVWLYIMGARYKEWLSGLFAPSFNFTPAVFFYFIYAFGVSWFVVSPALKSGASLWQVFGIGALFGLVVYAAYDLTNHATLRDWPLTVTVVDMAWGAVLTGLASIIVVGLVNYFKL